MKSWQADLVLLLLAVIWGSTFPLLKIGVAHIEPLNYIGYRYFFASILLALCFFPTLKNIKKEEALGGCVLGLFLSIGNILQAVGIRYTTASKAGFITGLYITILPFLAYFFLKTKLRWKHWVATFLALIGLYCLSINEALTFQKGDLWVLGSPFAYAVQMVLVNYYGEKYSAVALNIFQLLVAGVSSIILSFYFEGFQLNRFDIKGFGIFVYLITIATVFVFTVHLKVQPKTNPVRAGLILSLESVFAAIFSWFWIGEHLTKREILGATLMMAAVVVSEVKWESKTRIHGSR